MNSHIPKLLSFFFYNILTLKADEICLSATCYLNEFDAKLIMEEAGM